MAEKNEIFFSNDIDEITEIKDFLATKQILSEMITHPSSSPYFGTNTTLPVEDMIYKYSLKVQDADIDNAVSILDDHFEK